MKKISILLVVAAFAVIGCSRQSQEQAQSQSQTVELGEVPVVTSSSIEDCDKDVQIAVLSERVAWLERENDDLQARLDDCLGNKKTVRTPTPRPTPKPAPKVEKRVEIVTPLVKEDKQVAVVKTETPRARAPEVPGTANLSYLFDGEDAPFAIKVNEQDDCWFPHYAMDHGVTFNTSESNHISGFNLRAKPTSGFTGDYGLRASDGTFYFSDDIIQKSLQAGGRKFTGVVEIVSKYNNWELSRMTKEGRYWVFKTQ